ncbi:DNA cytosine methyltransferase [Flavobacterium silvaticum]|uniref:Cytosine-specific methyltransferase n=1 Tax=Flavobacterium silvaticum TaxID=1852020 RepID=A0A972FXB6_9FLAO|nr:DNA cytosine methyltransferase [Flavobacterium silvaticum]NMH26571.1 DNA cytosine methyltransferase [Flavobacterium silvaticum]
MVYKNLKTQTHFIDIQTFKSGSDSELPVVSLFTGAGGLDIGLENCGFETAVCIEYDTDCRETLRYNRPNWKLFEESVKITQGEVKTRVPGDVREIEVEELLKLANLERKEVSLVVGGAPCQPFSNIGKKLGKNDEKNGDLFLEFVRFVKGINPRAFIFENVVGITQNKHNDVINYMVDKFKGLGYGISYGILNAANYGVPQRRERFFLIGIKGVDKPAFPMPTHFESLDHFNFFTKHFDKSPVMSFKRWVSVKDAFKKITPAQNSRNDYALMNISETVTERMKLISQGQNFKVLPMEMRPNCWKTGKHQGNDTFGRIVEDLPSVTIRTAAYNPSKGMYIHPNENRGLSTIEMATLQSFPKNWEFKSKGRDKITLVSGGKQIGNAVPPLLAQALGRAILKQIISSDLKSVEKLSPLLEVN